MGRSTERTLTKKAFLSDLVNIGSALVLVTESAVCAINSHIDADLNLKKNPVFPRLPPHLLSKCPII